MKKIYLRRPAGFTSIVILLGIVFIILIGGVAVYQKVLAPEAQPTPVPVISTSPILTPTISTTPSSISQPSSSPDPTTDWKTYKNENIAFKVPAAWTEKALLARGSGSTQEFEIPGRQFAFTLLSNANYSQVTGKSFATIDEYINMPYQVKRRTVDGQEGRQPLPRAGSENINSVSFFSKDSKIIYTLELQTGDTTLDTSETEVEDGQKLFDQILSTFKFLD